MSDAVDVPPSAATGWPDISLLAEYTGVGVADPVLVNALAAAVGYGNLVLSDRYVGPVNDAVVRACLDYAGSIYTERIGQADVSVEAMFGSTSITRYRRILLASRFTAIA